MPQLPQNWVVSVARAVPQLGQNLGFGADSASPLLPCVEGAVDGAGAGEAVPVGAVEAACELAAGVAVSEGGGGDTGEGEGAGACDTGAAATGGGGTDAAGEGGGWGAS